MRAVSFSPDGRWLATAGSDQTVRVWDVQTGALSTTLGGHGSTVMAVAWSTASSKLAAGGTDGAVKLWHVVEDAFMEVLSLPGHPSGAWGLAFAPDGERLMVGDTLSSEARVFDVGIGGSAEWATMPGGGQLRDDVAFSPDGRELLFADAEGITAWDPTNGDRLRTVVRSGTRVRELALSGDGRFVASLRDDEHPILYVHDTGTGELVRRIEPDHEVWRIAWSADSRRVAAGGVAITVVSVEGGEVEMLDVTEGRYVQDLAYARDGRHLAIATHPPGAEVLADERVLVLDLLTGSITTEIDPGVWLHDIAVSPDSAYLTAGLMPGVWDVATGEQVLALETQTSHAYPVAASPDGVHVAAGNADGTVTVWDLARPQRPLVLRGHAGYVSGLAFDADGGRLASASVDGTVRVWALDLDDLLAIAATKLTRTPTEAECRQYAHLPLCIHDS